MTREVVALGKLKLKYKLGVGLENQGGLGMEVLKWGPAATFLGVWGTPSLTISKGEMLVL